jgi:hypothetical protein
MAVAIKIGNWHGADGAIGRTPGFRVFELAVAIIEIDQALAVIPAGEDDVVVASAANAADQAVCRIGRRSGYGRRLYQDG